MVLEEIIYLIILIPLTIILWLCVIFLCWDLWNE